MIIYRLGFSRSMILEADGFTGGIWFVWNHLLVNVVGRSMGNHILHVVITMKNIDLKTWVLSHVYASQSTEDRHKRW